MNSININGTTTVDPSLIALKVLTANTLKPSKISMADSELLSSKLKKEHLNAKTTLITEDEKVTKIWFVVNGTIEAKRHGKVIDIIKPPAVIGDDLAVTGEASPYTFETETPLNALTLTVKDFQDLLVSAPTLVNEWLKEIAFKLQKERNRLNYLLASNLNSQLAGLLFERKKNSQVELTQSMIASLLNVHRASVSRALHVLERQHIVEIKYASIKILDEEKLQKIATDA